MFLYCTGAMGDAVPLAAIGYSTNGANFIISNDIQTMLGANDSVLPQRLAIRGTTILNGIFSNWLYDGPTSNQDQDALQDAMRNENNWIGSDNRFQLDSDSATSNIIPMNIVFFILVGMLVLL